MDQHKNVERKEFHKRKEGYRAGNNGHRDFRKDNKREYKKDFSHKPGKFEHKNSTGFNKFRKTEEVEIKRLGINGEGIGYINQKITFVRGALPGEIVEIEITKDEKNFKEGKLVNIKKPSENRVPVCCEIQNHCLNCPLMILNDESIMYFKKDIIRDSLRKYTSIDFRRVETHNPILSDVRVDYVNEVHLPVVLFNDKPRVGIYQRDSKFLTVMDQCKLYHPIIRHILQSLEMIMEEDNIAVYNDDTRYGLRFVSIRVLEGSALVILVCGRNGMDPRFYEKVGKIENVDSVYYTVNTSKGQNFASGRYMKAYGNTNQEVTFMSTKYILTPKTVFPENTSSAAKVVEAVREMLGEEGKEILEVNGGCGYLSHALKEHHIKSIDYSKYNIQDASYAAKANRLTHCDYEYGDVPELMESICRNRSFDALIVHESKLGMNNHIKENVVKSRTKELIYISHSASSFAKDVGSLEKDYTLKTIVPIDFKTYNEEIVIVARFVRNEKK